MKSANFLPARTKIRELEAKMAFQGESKMLGVAVLGNDSGLLVSKVEDGSPASLAEIFEGDYLIAVGDRKLKSVEDFQFTVRKYAGTEVNILIRRDGEYIWTSVKLAGLP